jgi:Zn-dependent protease with chaperone function
MMLMSSAAAALAVVAVPENTAQVDAYALQAELLWSAAQLVGLLLPALLLFTGWGAKLRTLCARWTGGGRYRTLTLFATFYLLLSGLVVLPVRYWRLIVLEGRFGQPVASLPQFLLGQLVPVGAQIVVAALFLWLFVWPIRRAPRTWWLWSAFALVPVSFAVLVALPVFVDPLIADYRPLADTVLLAKIESFAARCGIGEIPVFVGGDDDTVVGLGPTNRVFLEDGIQKRETPGQIEFTVAHEMKHYVLGDNWKALAILFGFGLAGLWLVDRFGRKAIARWHHRFGFEDLHDPAALPLIVLILSLFWLCVLPLFNWEARHIEREADRFGLELSHQNRAAAELFAGWAHKELAQTRYDLFFQLFRQTHPSLAERIEFANTYHPWRDGGPLAYGNVCRAK